MKANLRRSKWGFLLCLLVLCSCDLHKKLADLQFKQGIKKIEAGDNAGAMDDFSACISQNSQYADAYYYRGSIYLEKSNYVAAIKDFDQAIALHANGLEIYTYRGIAMQGLNDFSGAVSNYSEAIKLEPYDSAALTYRGLARTALRDWDGALADLNHAAELNPDDWETYRGRAVLQYMRQEYEAAATDASKVIELNDKDSISYRIRGLVRTRLRDFTNALTDFDESIALNSHDADAFAGRGYVRVIQGDLKGAEADLGAASQLNPTNAMAKANLGIIKIKRGDLAGALAVYTNVLAIATPFSYPEIYFEIGYLQYDLHQDDAAQMNLRKALELDERKSPARFWLWMVRARGGAEAEASKELKDGMAAHPLPSGHDWEICIGQFLSGDLAETNFVRQAIETVKRPVDKPRQLCEADYYAGMRRLFHGDKTGATKSLNECVALQEKNTEEYYSAVVQLKEMQEQ